MYKIDALNTILRNINPNIEIAILYKRLVKDKIFESFIGCRCHHQGILDNAKNKNQFVEDIAKKFANFANCLGFWCYWYWQFR